MDILLDAFDRIQEISNDNLDLRFFNIYDYKHGVDMKVDCGEDRYDFEWNDDYMVIYLQAYIAGYNQGIVEATKRIPSNVNANQIVQAYETAAEVLINKQNATLNRLGQNKNRMKQTYQSNLDTEFDNENLTVPIDIMYDDEYDSEYGYDYVPSDEEMKQLLEDSLDIEATNRLIKEISIRYLYSGVAICLYPKVRLTRLRVVGRVKDPNERLDSALRSLSYQASGYFRKLEDYLSRL